MDEAVGAALKEDEQVIERIAGEVRDLLIGFPMDGWSEA
jgi:glycine hydroxymethyltransferase